MLFRLSGLRVRDRWLTKWEEAARQVKLLSILFHQTTSAKKKRCQYRGGAGIKAYDEFLFRLSQCLVHSY